MELFSLPVLVDCLDSELATAYAGKQSRMQGGAVRGRQAVTCAVQCSAGNQSHVQCSAVQCSADRQSRVQCSADVSWKGWEGGS